MITRLSLQQIGKRIALLRKRKDYSQEDLSKFLEIPRSSVTQMELGNRNISILEFMKLSELLGFSLDRFLGEYKIENDFEFESEKNSNENDIRISIPQFKIKKFQNVLLYMLERCGGKPNVGDTVLYNLLYFSDFNYYEIYEEHMTGMMYHKLAFGPVPRNINELIDQLIKNAQLQRIKTDYNGYPLTRYIPLEKADLTEISAAEKDTIDRVIDQFSDRSASAISEYVRMDMPWKATEDGDTLDYELALYREPPFSVRIYADGSGQS